MGVSNLHYVAMLNRHACCGMFQSFAGNRMHGCGFRVLFDLGLVNHLCRRTGLTLQCFTVQRVEPFARQPHGSSAHKRLAEII